MVNYHDPIVLRRDTWAMTKIWHAVGGLYFWEFVSTLDYKWSVIRGHRPFRWTMLIYSTTRMSTLLGMILTLVDINDYARFNCQAEFVFQLFFAYLAYSSASLLIVLRILAIWKKKIITAIAGGIWGISVIFQVQAIVRIRASWAPYDACVVTNVHITVLNVLVTLATDISLLLIMFFGLLRLGFHERGAFGLGRLLWKQGVIWLLVATIAEVPPAVFLCLNLNDPLNGMFFPPSVITLSVAATRIYRSLADHVSFGCINYLSGLDSSERGGRMEWRNRAPITLSRVEVTIDRTSDQDQTLQTGKHGSLACIEEQLCKKPSKQCRLDELEIAEIPENDVECHKTSPIINS